MSVRARQKASNRKLLTGFFTGLPTTGQAGTAVVIAIGIEHLAVAIEAMHLDLASVRVLLPVQDYRVTNTD